MALKFQCPHCRTQVSREIRQWPRGTRYGVLFDCPKCSHTIHIKGVAQKSPPVVVKP